MIWKDLCVEVLWLYLWESINVLSIMSLESLMIDKENVDAPSMEVLIMLFRWWALEQTLLSQMKKLLEENAETIGYWEINRQIYGEKVDISASVVRKKVYKMVPALLGMMLFYQWWILSVLKIWVLYYE